MQIFEFRDYKEYLSQALSDRGAKAALAHALDCHTTYISQVINAKTHFSFEHCLQVAEFLKLKKEETDYFILLLSLGKAGTRALEEYYLEKIEEIQAARKHYEGRVQTTQKLSEKDQARYYGAWYFSAIHILLLIPRFRSIQSISEHLQLSADLVSRCLEFLTEVGLAIRKENLFEPGPARIHLSKNSDFVARQHINWRIKTIEAVEKSRDEDLHFSGAISISASAFQEIREMALKFLESTEPYIRDSKEEELYFLGLDLFQV